MPELEKVKTPYPSCGGCYYWNNKICSSPSSDDCVYAKDGNSYIFKLKLEDNQQ